MAGNASTLTGRMTRANLLRAATAVLAGGAGGALLQACAGGSAGGASGQGSAQSKQPVKLSFEWPTYTQPKQDWAEAAIKMYQEKFPNVTVEPLWNKNPTEILTTTLASGQPPDVGWFGVGHWAFYKAFRPVEQFMSQRKLRLEDYFSNINEAMKWRGKMYAFPMGINTSAMFVHKPIYQKAGVPLPSDDQTWDDLVATGKRLTSGEGAQKVWGNNAQYYTNYWPPAYGGGWYDADGTKVTFNNSQTLKVLQLLREMWDKQGISPSPAEIANYGANPWLDLFATGHVAQYAGGTWGLPPFRQTTFDWDLAEVPTLVDGSKKTKGAFCGTEEIFIVAGQPREEAAADFAAWMIGPEHLAFAGKRGDIIPAHQKTAKEAFVTSGSETRPKNIQAFVRAANYAPPISPHPQYNDLIKAYNTAVNKWLGSATAPESTLTAQQALDEAQQQMQRILDDFNKANPK